MENPNEKQKSSGKLYIVSTPIGNSEDITLRALRLLKACDFVICEEAKVGASLLRKYNVSKRIETLNEHNEEEKAEDIVLEIAEGKNAVLISDCGTPLLADPGDILVKTALRRNVEIVVAPGATSVMTALVRSGFSLAQFLFAGFLSRDKSKRIKQLQILSKEKRTVVLLETPYRLLPVLEAAAKVMPFRNAYLGCNLTYPYETHHYGAFVELYEKFKEMRFKGEFVIVFEGLPNDDFAPEKNSLKYPSAYKRKRKTVRKKK